MNNAEVLGIIAALLSAASWAFATVLFDRLGKVIPSAGITFLKGALSIAMMSVLILFTGGLTEVRQSDIVCLAFSGIIGISLGDTLFFKSLQDLGAKVQVLYFLLGQVVTMLLSFLLLGDVLTVIQYIGGLVLLAGIVVVIWGKQEDHPNKKRGIILGFLSILCYSISTIMVKVSIGETDVVTATFYRMVTGTIVILFAGVTSKKIVEWLRPLHDIKTIFLFFINVVVITFGGFMLSMLAIKNISVSLASILGATEPIFVLLFAWMINHEHTSKQELFGAALSITGLLIILLYG